MKKFTVTLLSALFILASVCPVSFAAEAFTATLAYDAATDKYTVSGTLAEALGNVPMLLSVEDSKGNFYTGFQTTAVRNAEGVTFSFAPLSFPADAPTDVYTLRVTSDFYPDEQDTFAVSVFSVSDKYTFLKELNTKINAGGVGVCDHVSGKADYLGLDSAAFTALDSASKGVFDAFLKTTYTLPQEAPSLGDETALAQVDAAWKQCCTDAYYALAAARLVNVHDEATCKLWLADYYTVLAIGTENTATDYSEAKIDGYFKTVQSSAAFVRRISAVTSVADTAAIIGAVHEAVLLSAIETMQYTAVSDIISNFRQLIPVNATYYSRLSSYPDTLGEIYTEMAGTSYADYDAAATAFDTLASKKLASSSQGGTSSSGGGGRGGSSSGGVYVKDTVTKDTVTAEGFTDLSQAEWAREAIEYLTSKNIISGRGNGLFVPNDTITRAEFIKIVVMARGLSTADVSCNFADVADDAWYYAYAAAAQQAGIVYGDSDGCFNPNSFISRQDMATILYRAFGLSGEGDGSHFADYNDIADYAKEAVGVLSGRGIINGLGDGSFAPMANATRAQAAQMIYNIVK